MDSLQNGTCADHYEKTNNVGSGQLRYTIWHFTALNLHPNLNNGKKEVREEEKSSSMLGLFEVFCFCFIISCILSKCTETKSSFTLILDKTFLARIPGDLESDDQCTVGASRYKPFF